MRGLHRPLPALLLLYRLAVPWYWAAEQEQDGARELQVLGGHSANKRLQKEQHQPSRKPWAGERPPQEKADHRAPLAQMGPAGQLGEKPLSM